jgi:long-chain acyl-CoA synthetase
MSFNLATILREASSAHPHKPLCHLGEQTFTYAQVDEISGRIATSLRALGVGRGDKVAVQLPNVPHFLFAYFGILKVGAVLVPLDPLLRAPEICYHLTICDARLLITFETLAEEAVRGTAEIDGLRTYVVKAPIDAHLPASTHHFDELYFGENTEEIEPTDADDTAVIVYTSGTTGKPKGAELTHSQLYISCTGAGELLGFCNEDIGMAVLPLFHAFGLSSVLNVSVRFGGTLVLVPSFDPRTVLDELARHRCTIFSGVPTMYIALLQVDAAGRDLTALRLGICGGAPIPGEVIRALEHKFPTLVILQGYGMSETASLSTVNVNAEHRKVRSIGKPIWGVQLRVVGEDGNEPPPGPEHLGEIVLRGYTVMKGYYNDSEATAGAFRNGWLYTGDLGYRDEDGDLFVVGRKNDIVNRDRYNVCPE